LHSNAPPEEEVTQIREAVQGQGVAQGPELGSFRKENRYIYNGRFNDNLRLGDSNNEVETQSSGNISKIFNTKQGNTMSGIN
jgi:hypothetical protein